MLATLVPLFYEDMSVAAYSLYAQRENMFENPSLLGSGAYDGAGSILGIEVLNNVSVDTLTRDSSIVVPLNSISIFSDVSEQFKGPKERIILLIDSTVKSEEVYISRVKLLHEAGYVLAMNKLPVTRIEEYKELLEYVDYFFVDCSAIEPLKQGMICSKLLPEKKLVAENIPDNDTFESVKESKLFTMFEGDFYRIPINKQDTTISPLRLNYFKILKIINTPNFDLTKVASVIGQDPALTISLLEIVNKLTLNSNISSLKQATALLGQRELKKWLNATIVCNLCTEKPNEITRLSLLRAKFAENLACVFDFRARADELFLLGLFSLIDYVLDKPMKEALEIIPVSDDIASALIDETGQFGTIYHFLRAYEAGDWQEVSRQMIVSDIHMELVYQSYVDSLRWYKNMFM